MAEVTQDAEVATLLDASNNNLNASVFRDFDWYSSLDQIALKQCLFENIKFRCDEILECHFTDCTFIQWHFDGHQIRDCQFDNCHFYSTEQETGSSFKFCDLTATQFHHCDLSMCNFSRANLYRAEIQHCQGQGMDLSHTTVDNIIGSSIVLQGAIINDCNLSYADLTGARIVDSEFNENRLTHAILNLSLYTSPSPRDRTRYRMPSSA